MIIQIQQAMISLHGMAEFYVYMNIVRLYLSKTKYYVHELFEQIDIGDKTTSILMNYQWKNPR